MTAAGPTSSPPQPGPGNGAAQASSAVARAGRMNAANMVRSLLPLVVICLALVGYAALGHPDDPVREVDPSNTVRLAAARAGYPLLVPTGLPEGYRPTSARTDAGEAAGGESVTLEIGYLTPAEEYAGFVVSDDPRARPVATVLDDASQEGTVDVGGRSWTRGTTQRGETVLSREADGVTVLVTGSASDAELEAVAAAVRPYSG